jgi:hypothetical protein
MVDGSLTRLREAMNAPDVSALLSRLAYRYDVFISYSASRETEARAIYDALRSEMTVFFAPESLPLLSHEPDQYVEVLSDALTQSCQVLVLLSQSFLDSAWCQLELNGAFNLMLAQDARRLWIGILEAGMEREIGGQFVPLLCEPDAAVAKVRQRFHEAEVKVGDRFASHTPPKLFAPLPLYELYEPPSARRRPPWGKDARAPHGVPGAPPYWIYEAMVRETMIQLARRRGGKPPDPFSQDDEELVLSIPMQGVSERYAFLSTAARRDADALLRLGFLGYSGRGRLDGRAMFARSVQARLQGQSHGELDLHDAFGRICMGQLEEIDRLEQAIARNETAIDLNFYRIELARAKYLAKDYSGALAVLETIANDDEAKLVREACLARLGQLADGQRDTNAQSAVRVDALRMHSAIEDRAQLDFWAEGLELAGYRR